MKGIVIRHEFAQSSSDLSRVISDQVHGQWAAVVLREGAHPLRAASKTVIYIQTGSARLTREGEAALLGSGDLVEVEAGTSCTIEAGPRTTLLFRYESELQQALLRTWNTMSLPRLLGRFEKTGLRHWTSEPRALLYLHADRIRTPLEDLLFCIPDGYASLSHLCMTDLLQWRFDCSLGGLEAFEAGAREPVHPQDLARLRALGIQDLGREGERTDAAVNTASRLRQALLVLELERIDGYLNEDELLLSDGASVWRWMPADDGEPLLASIQRHLGPVPNTDAAPQHVSDAPDDRALESIFRYFWTPEPPFFNPPPRLAPFPLERLALGSGISVSHRFKFRWWARVVCSGGKSMMNCDYFSVERTGENDAEDWDEWHVWHRTRIAGSGWRYRTSRRDGRVLERELMDSYD